jgi:hypothetical protein
MDAEKQRHSAARLIGPVCGAVMLVVGAWLVARRQF